MANTRGQIIVGKMSPEDYVAGGAWMIGDRYPESHRFRRDDLCYKSWVALPDRYAPGRKPFVDRAEAGWAEYVQVFTGRLDLLLEESQGHHRTTLEYPQDVWIPPARRRTWELPEECACARGATLLMKMSPASQASSGLVFSCWDDESGLPLIRSHAGVPGWSVQYVEVFVGSVRWRCLLGDPLTRDSVPRGNPGDPLTRDPVPRGNPGDPPTRDSVPRGNPGDPPTRDPVPRGNPGEGFWMVLEPGEHIFLPREIEGAWEIISTPARGISLAF